MKVLAALLFLLVLAPAAQAGWGPTRILSGSAPANYDLNPRAAVAPDGDAIVAWRSPTADADQSLGPISMVEASNGGAFTRARSLAPAGSVPAVAIDAAGRGAVAYDTRRGIRLRLRDASGTWGKPVVVERPAANQGNADVRIAWAGAQLVVVWTRLGRKDADIKTAIVSRTGRVSGARTVGSGRFWRGGELGADPSGHAAVSWTQSDGPLAEGRVLVSRRAPGRSFADGVVVDRSPDGAYGSAADAGPDGEAGVAWTRAHGPESDRYGSTLTALAPGGDPFAAAVDRSRRPQIGWEPHVAFTSTGAPLAAWIETAGPANANDSEGEGAVILSAGFGRPLTVARSTTKAKDVGLGALDRDRALLTWRTASGWRSAVHRPGARPAIEKGPAGTSERFHTFHRVHDLATAGTIALLVWDQGDRVRAAFGRFT